MVQSLNKSFEKFALEEYDDQDDEDELEEKE